MSSATRQHTTTAVIPAPRRAADDAIPHGDTSTEETSTAPRPELPAARYPWPEPWRSYRGARPRTEFWDEASATWLSRGPVVR